MLEVRKSRTAFLVEIAAEYIEVKRRKGDVTNRVVRKLKASRARLKTMYSDVELRPIAEKTLEVVNHMLKYIKTKEQRFLDAAIKAHHEADALIYILRAESGGKNGA